MTRFGVVLPQHEAGQAELVGSARLAEEAGLDSVWLSDHLWGYIGGRERPVLEGWSSLATVAGVTSRTTVGSLVTRVSIRLPRLTAAMAENLSRISGGRFVLGLGISDASNRQEQSAYGIAFGSRGRRLGLLEETMALVRELQPDVPVWVGGVSDAILEIASRADGWNFWGPAEDFARHRARLDAVATGGLPETSWAGSYPGPEGVDRLIEAGCDHVIVAVGAGNFAKRIAQLASLAEK